MNSSVHRRLRRVVTPHASASARERARERARARETRNPAHSKRTQNALKTHSNAITRAHTRRANDTRIDSIAPCRAFAFSATARDSKSIEMRIEWNAIRFDSIRNRPAFVAVAFVFVVERRAVGRPRRRPRRHPFRTVARAHTHATRADAPAHLEAWERRDMSRVMTRHTGHGSISP